MPIIIVYLIDIDVHEVKKQFVAQKQWMTGCSFVSSCVYKSLQVTRREGLEAGFWNWLELTGPLFGFTCILFLNCFCFRRLSRVNCEPNTNVVLGEQLKRSGVNSKIILDKKTISWLDHINHTLFMRSRFLYLLIHPTIK